MAGDDDPNSSVHEEDDDDDKFYDPYNDFGHLTEEELNNVMSDSNPNLMDIDFTDSQNPPPSPLAPQDSNMEINETQMLQELSLNIPNGEDNSAYESFDDNLYLSWEMFEPPNDDATSNNVQGETGGNDTGDENNLVVIDRTEVSTLVLGENGMNFVVGNGRLEVSTRVFGENPTNFEIGGPSTRPVPVTPTIHIGILICSCCQPLRGVVHTNGLEIARLDIYGETGSFCHAVLETHPFGDSNRREHQSLVLKDMKMEDVQRFIENYLSEREVNGFRLVHDTNAALSSFYRAMNAGPTNNQRPMLTMPPATDVPMALAMPDASLNVPPVPRYVPLRDIEPTGNVKVRQRRNTPLAAQRERTGRLTLDDVKKYFHLPIEHAARRMDVCPTVLKKICRRGGLPRWPYRKIKSLQRKIAALKEEVLKAEDPEAKAEAEEEIVKLHEEIKQICEEAMQNSKDSSS
ncbi:unnamed protein product [Arabis nemorensis]|uniref:RWP-RK domain-containing protein n=1 Tax=Arabis nemorensis TaxID=586526 RepID=A0A565CM85_9BRAS|nr:unnamed protein product [Arabis nemorensis]